MRCDGARCDATRSPIPSTSSYQLAIRSVRLHLRQVLKPNHLRLNPLHLDEIQPERDLIPRQPRLHVREFACRQRHAERADVIERQRRVTPRPSVRVLRRLPPSAIPTGTPSSSSSVSHDSSYRVECDSKYNVSIRSRADVHCDRLKPWSATAAMLYFSHGSLHKLYWIVTC